MTISLLLASNFFFQLGWARDSFLTSVASKDMKIHVSVTKRCLTFSTLQVESIVLKRYGRDAYTDKFSLSSATIGPELKIIICWLSLHGNSFVDNVFLMTDMVTIFSPTHWDVGYAWYPFIEQLKAETLADL
jgi:hypothetical protein